MSGIKQYEPLWGAWKVDSLIGEGSFGKVYKVSREEFGITYYSAVKIITIPQSDADLRQIQSEGMDEASLKSFFQAFVADIVQEIKLLNELRGNSNIVSLEDHKVIEKPEELRWDILIRMELLTSLTEFMSQKPLTNDDIIKLGIAVLSKSPASLCYAFAGSKKYATACSRSSPPRCTTSTACPCDTAFKHTSPPHGKPVRCGSFQTVSRAKPSNHSATTQKTAGNQQAF